MKKLGASIVKEFLLLINDKVGLLLMYLMPVLLVFIITLVQDSTFKLVNENKLELLIINDASQRQLGRETLSSIAQSNGVRAVALDM